MSKARERFCWNCGASMGVFKDKDYRRSDTCGRSECEREAHYEVEAERAEAHRRLDDDNGWSW